MEMITERDFDREVLQSKSLVFSCFVTRWCHSCYPTCLFADELEKAYRDKVKFVRVDVGEIPHLSAGYRITAVPTILLFKDSQPVKRLLGLQDPQSLRRLLESVIEKDELPQREEPDESPEVQSRGVKG
jgi:thioredoxin 1